MLCLAQFFKFSISQSLVLLPKHKLSIVRDQKLEVIRMHYGNTFILFTSLYSDLLNLFVLCDRPGEGSSEKNRRSYNTNY